MGREGKRNIGGGGFGCSFERFVFSSRRCAAIFTRHPSMKFRFAVEAWCDFFKKAGERAKKGDDVSR